MDSMPFQKGFQTLELMPPKHNSQIAGRQNLQRLSGTRLEVFIKKNFEVVTEANKATVKSLVEIWTEE
jgi:hypothetical protein